MAIKYIIKSFNELDTAELYQILKLRNEVFIVEQQCVYLDIDDKDQDSYHLMYFIDDYLAGYTRLLPAGLSYEEVSIGRVIIGSEYRKLGLGKQLMEKSIVFCKDVFQTTTIHIGAQFHLRGFYNSLGFKEIGDPYDEDGILHIEMVKK